MLPKTLYIVQVLKMPPMGLGYSAKKTHQRYVLPKHALAAKREIHELGGKARIMKTSCHWTEYEESSKES